ncbi:MAG: hypothetical protein A3H28_05510 [Acidobacteria bacterium RIFCSPLOWO2_02_FULL_61_28]|nr:MAG: hypothetical protein A3H28_05510 [Acidobacteria bacterium RIFCSPLOWO2_02_FULL_61_28]
MTVSLNNLMSEQTARLLASFSHTANRSMPHPSDQQLWRQFLIAAHKENARLDESTLKQWLVEEGGWLEDVVLGISARDLVSQYNFARDLLRDYDEFR